ncbi:hypothetical protein PISMIDRAFT_314313 [Pisolithus microcarpus 441]|uniref:Domain of unknown function at the cortex 1 domain-containing protein n=1 Tax=Pisolithus microcarpus 441 TaxID=765257 RepID=A0A0D0A1H0_9AGAM|nr:hypothetical protein PISMIDRAFT_314313 [Pisolithus microcarpus 441]
MPGLRVRAGTCVEDLQDITELVNTGRAHPFRSEQFEGQVAIYIKGFRNSHGQPSYSEYFQRPDRKGITWSVQVKGRFLRPRSANEILLGNTFDRALSLPWGSSLALQFAKFVDPALEHDLTSDAKPWALSPLVVTVPHFKHARVDHVPGGQGEFPPCTSITDDTSQLGMASMSPANDNLRGTQIRKDDQAVFPFRTPGERKKYFSKESNRKDLVFGPDDIVTIDFCYGFLEFYPDIILRLPAGITFDLMKYWDKQPIRFVCGTRRRPSEGGKEEGDEPIADMFWCVEVVSADDDEAVSEKDGDSEEVD